MEVKNAKGLVEDRNGRFDLKRKRAVRCAAYFAGTARGNACPAESDLPPSKRYQRAVDGAYGNGCKCCSGKAVVEHYLNFMKSGLPKRVLYYEKGEWVDMSAPHVASLQEAFQLKKTAVDMVFNGQPMLLDFSHMCQVNLETGSQQKIAWIDESGKCFFPEVCCEGEELCSNGYSGGREDKKLMKVNLEPGIKVHCNIEISGVDSSRTKEQRVCATLCDLPKIPEKLGSAVKIESDFHQAGSPAETSDSNGPSPINSEKSVLLSCENDAGGPQNSATESADGMAKLKQGESMYKKVEGLFLSGFGAYVNPGGLKGIYCSSFLNLSTRSRFQSFVKQVESMEKHRGDANVRYGWYRCSEEEGRQIMLHGFKHSPPGKDSSWGVGIHLLPADRSTVSTGLFDVDENRVHHMVLCRVILGNVEKVRFGSKQFGPSNEDFDSGVDEIENPKQYVVWNLSVNTHIYPEYLVSFVVPPNTKASSIKLEEHDIAHVKSAYCSSVQLQYNPVNMSSDSLKCVPAMKCSQPKIEAPDSGISRAPTSAWLPFPMLFAAITNKISSTDKDLVDFHYTEYKDRKITRNDLIGKLRCIVGDEVLKSTIKNLQSKVVIPSSIASYQHA